MNLRHRPTVVCGMYNGICRIFEMFAIYEQCISSLFIKAEQI